MPIRDLRKINSFEDLRDYLEGELDWRLEGYEFDDLTFTYEPEELGLKNEDAAKVRQIRQLRPLKDGQPWGIFFIEFEKTKLPVVVLRRILSSLVIKKRQSANKADRAAFKAEDLLFITRFGTTSEPEIAFAHFHQGEGDLPTLRVLDWDGSDTVLKLEHVAATLKSKLRWPDDPSDNSVWREQWTAAFRHRIGHVIKTSDALAETLAALAQRIRDAARTLMKAESERGQLRTLFKAFQASLIHDLDEDSFADTYAQTITYGLLTAAISRTEMSEGRHGTALIADNIADIVPVTNPFLKEMLQTFLKVGGRKGGINFDDLGTQDVVELLRGEETDLPAILRDFGNRTQGEDPVSHFYEHFLEAYNKKLKVQRGVFYTPRPVVSYIVRSVDELLKTEFGLEDGLASTVTWAEMAKKHAGLTIPEGVEPKSMFVQILDPATGTATFLVEVIEVIHQHLQQKWTKGGLKAMPALPPSSFARQADSFETYWNQYVPLALLPRLYGYELMMAPYAIAHMKIGLKLFETGYRFASEERARIYLTNALEPWQKQLRLPEFDALAHEAAAVNEIKCHKRFTAVIGNPPYARHSSNPNKDADGRLTFIGQLIEEYKEGCPELRKPAQAKYLQDDYVKFTRFSEYAVVLSGVGVIGLITNHGFLDNPTFRGMRNHLLGSLAKAAVLDLHGNANKKERSPDGSEDKNVFDIKQGVAILIAARHPTTLPCKVLHGDLWGSRENKYRRLSSSSWKALSTTPLNPHTPQFSLRPRDETNEAEYLAFPSVTEIFSPNGSPAPGIVTTHDSFAVAFSEKEIVANVETLLDSKNEDEAREHFRLCTQDQWSYSDARRELADGKWRKKVIPLHYRPFDTRFTVYDSNVAVHRRERVTQHLVSGGNMAILTSRMTKGETFKHVQVTRLVPEVICMSPMTSNNGFVFPLWLKAEGTQTQQSNLFGDGRRVNLGRDFLNSLSSVLRVKPTGSFGVPSGLTPEDIFHYTYAVLHSPGYRSRYAEFLKGDFPRLPLTANLGLLRTLARLGSELVALHLLESPKVDKSVTEFIGDRNLEVEKVSWSKNTVWVDKAQTAGFKGVREDVWNFHIGGYQVCEKWLKDRKGRKLSKDDVAHYQKIVVSLSETISLMGEIDNVIDQHGGWPKAFA